MKKNITKKNDGNFYCYGVVFWMLFKYGNGVDESKSG